MGTKSVAEGIAKAKMAEVAGKTLASIIVGWIPGIGNVIKAGVAVTMVESIGWQTAKEFDQQSRS